MPLRAQFHLDLPNIPLTDPARAVAIAEQVFLPAVEEATLLAQREIVSNTPVGATAILRGSVQQAVEVIRGTPVQFHGTVESAQPYSVAVEEGTRPHWAPIGPLKLWARRILGDEDAAYAVRAAIARRGTRGQRFFARGVEAASPRILAILRRAGETFAARLRRG
jgi:hypothetical protein